MLIEWIPFCSFFQITELEDGMKTVEEETRDLQSQDEQVRLLLDAWYFYSTTVFCSVSQRIMWQRGFLFSVQAQTTLKVYSMSSDRLNRNLETAGEESTLLQESNVQVRWWMRRSLPRLFGCLSGYNRSCDELLATHRRSWKSWSLPSLHVSANLSLTHSWGNKWKDGRKESVSWRPRWAGARWPTVSCCRMCPTGMSV